MKLYDSIILQTLSVLEKAKPLSPAPAWPDSGASELVMQRDAAFELGGSGEPSVNYTCVTTGDFFAESGVFLLGNDLPALKADAPFARIVLLLTDEISEDDAGHDMIRGMEFVRYHVFPKGYMVRVSSTSYEEQVRVSKAAVKSGISFAAVGADYLEKYKAVPGVKAVRVCFITDKAAVEALKPNAKKVDDITKTLSHILDGLEADCGHCSLKAVCDEVEGMREMHLGKKK
ncbi:MAG: carbon monoxide dehydrogenase [Lachnospiraceae bacterium]|nr:carbon monoxide dehydrogenase [Lachnospiraceae bacterium]